MLKSLANVLKVSGCKVPEWIFSLKSMTKKDKKHLEKFPLKREHISLDPTLHVEKDPEYSKTLAIN